MLPSMHPPPIRIFIILLNFIAFIILLIFIAKRGFEFRLRFFYIFNFSSVTAFRYSDIRRISRIAR